MRKTVFWIIGILAVILLVANSQSIAEIFLAMAQGAIIPLICAALFEFGRYAMQAAANVAAFNTVNEEASWKKMFTLILSGTFINTLAPSGGTVYYALIIDDANDRGIPVGKSTSASLMMQMFLLSGFLVIMLIGFTVMQAAGKLTLGFFICGMLIALIAAFFGGILFVCRKSPAMLRSFLHPIERFVGRIAIKIRRNHKPPKPWADKFVDSLDSAAQAMGKNKREAWACFGFMILANGCEMMCFIMSGFAFGVTAVNALIGAYVITNIFTIISPSPNGVGFAEATATVVLTSFGTAVALSTAVALTFRGFVFWIPFVIGALLLRRTGFFSKKNESEEEKAKTTGHLAALFAFVFGLANILFAVLPNIPENFNILSQWLSVGNVLSSTVVVAFSVILMLMTRGLRKRSRTTWAVTLLLLIYLAVAQFVGSKTIYVAIAILVFGAWLWFKRRSFDKLLVYENTRSTISPILYAVFITLGYGICGYYSLADQFQYTWDLTQLDAIWATIQTVLPFGDPTPLSGQAAWFISSVKMVAIITVIWAVIAILFPWLRKQRYEGKINGDTGVWRTVQSVEKGFMADADKGIKADVEAGSQEGGSPQASGDSSEDTMEQPEPDRGVGQVFVDVSRLVAREGLKSWMRVSDAILDQPSEEDLLMQDVYATLRSRRELNEEDVEILDKLEQTSDEAALEEVTEATLPQKPKPVGSDDDTEPIAVIDSESLEDIE